MIPVASLKEIQNNLKKSDFLLNCKIPMGYCCGLPVLQIRNGCLCANFPYLKYQTTGEVDRTLVYPIKYSVTLELPTEKVVSFEDYEYKEIFKNVDFSRPVGLFRHEAIRHCDKKQYRELRRELMEEYDKVINWILGNRGYASSDEKRMRELLQLLVEPSLLPMYRVIDKDFYKKYLERE